MNDRNVRAKVDSRHWTADDVVNFLYGIGPEDGHLERCADCAARVAAVQARKSVVAAPPDVDPLFLAAQRRAVMGQLEMRPRRNLRWLSAMAATAAAVAMFWAYPRQGSQQEMLTAASDGVYAEAYYDIVEPAPRAVGAIDQLFDGGGMD